ncbi:MAG: hypothetical protein L6R28_21910 [Planctomycetes bacterium]|nr:hypothetical protein [Planctomycetota bacterium]
MDKPLSPLCARCDYGAVGAFIEDQWKEAGEGKASPGKRAALEYICEAGRREDVNFRWICKNCKLLALHRTMRRPIPDSEPLMTRIGKEIVAGRIRHFLAGMNPKTPADRHA